MFHKRAILIGIHKVFLEGFIYRNTLKLKCAIMENADTHQEWRFWPVIILAFFYPVNNALINLAIPLYFFKEGISIEMIGVIAAGAAITYAFSPILFRKVSEKLGRKKSIILGISGALSSQLIFYFTLHPIPFLIARMMEGLLMGFFWINLQSSISDNALHDHSKMMSRYNIAWNSGLLVGNLIGAIFLFVIDNVELIFYIAPIFFAINVFIAILFFKESAKIDLDSSLEVRESENHKNNKSSNLELTAYYIPIIIPVILIIAFSVSKASVMFLYPIKSETLNFESYTVYLLVFFCILAQLIGTASATYFSIKNLKRIPLVCIISLIIVLMIYGLTTDFSTFFMLFLLLGFFCGLLYGFSLKLTIILNMKENTSKYSSLLESIIGTGFLVTPITCGFIAGIGLNSAFYIISIVLILQLIISIIYIRKIVEIKD